MWINSQYIPECFGESLDDAGDVSFHSQSVFVSLVACDVQQPPPHFNIINLTIYILLFSIVLCSLCPHMQLKKIKITIIIICFQYLDSYLLFMQLKKVIPWQKNFAFPYIEKNIQLLKFQTLLLPLGYFASVTSIASALEKWLQTGYFSLLFFPCQKCVRIFLKQQKWRVPSLKTLVIDVLRWALLVTDAPWYKTRLTDFQSPQYKMYWKCSLCSFVDIQAIGRITGAAELLNQFFFASAFWWISSPCGTEEVKDNVLCVENAELSNFKDLF